MEAEPPEAHAGARLDLAGIDQTLHRHDHDHSPVQPIPWKTGKVGAVAAIDQATALPFVAPVLRLRTPKRRSLPLTAATVAATIPRARRLRRSRRRRR